MSEILQIALIISFASLGFRAITGKNMIFYFIREPFDRLDDDDPVKYAMKPVLLCSTCMASVHTLYWFPIITGEFFTVNLILVMLIVAILNTLIWSVVELVQKHS